VEQVKIGLIGPHGAGKTTLVRDFCSEYPWITPITSASRDVHAAGWPLNQDATPLSQFLVSMARINKEQRAYETNNRMFISDRTPLDSIAYTLVQMDDFWAGGKSSPMKYYLSVAEELAVRHTRQYDKVFFIEPLDHIAYDGTRPTGEEYRNKVCTYMRQLCEENGIECVSIHPASRQARLEILAKNVFGVV
jgi:predicted ATPase